MNEDFSGWIVLSAAAVPLIILGGCWGMPHYDVWQQGMHGQAELSRAEYNRQIQTCDAKAKLESAKALSDAEVVRAQGVAKANEIIGTSLKNNEAYLRYLWILGMQTNNMQVVYVPTEANLPILESQRFGQYIHHKPNQEVK